MPNFPGETFVSNGCKYILRVGPKGNLRPYYLGPVVAAGARAGWIGLAIAGLVLVGAVLVAALCDEEDEACSEEEPAPAQ